MKGWLSWYDYRHRPEREETDRERRDRQREREREVNKEYLGKNTTKHHSRCVQLVFPDT